MTYHPTTRQFGKKLRTILPTFSSLYRSDPWDNPLRGPDVRNLRPTGT